MRNHSGWFIGVAIAAMVSAPAAAQDFQTFIDGAAVQQSAIANGNINKHRARQVMERYNGRSGGASAAEARTRATCMNKGRAAQNLGPDHPSVRRLFSLCAQAGY
jgi:hypothetical protein